MYFFSLKNCTRSLCRTGASFVRFHLGCGVVGLVFLLSSLLSGRLVVPIILVCVWCGCRSSAATDLCMCDVCCMCIVGSVRNVREVGFIIIIIIMILITRHRLFLLTCLWSVQEFVLSWVSRTFDTHHLGSRGPCAPLVRSNISSSVSSPVNASTETSGP